MDNKSFLNRFTSIYTDKSVNGYVRGVIWVATGVVIYMVGSKIYGSIFPSQQKIDAKAHQNQVESELNNNAAKGITPSYPDSQYTDWATNIETAMSGCDYSHILIWSFGFQKVKNIFDLLKNDADYLKLQKAFGIRTISKHWWCGGDFTDVDFEQAVSKQFDQPEIAILNSSLSSNGITYRLIA